MPNYHNEAWKPGQFAARNFRRHDPPSRGDPRALFDTTRLLAQLHPEQRAARRLRRPVKWAGPDLIITNIIHARKKDGARSAGITEALAKPIDPDDLLAAVKRCLKL